MLNGKVGFKEARRRLINALQQGTFLHEARSQVDTKKPTSDGTDYDRRPV